jgi:hypothetical protein
MKQPAVIVAVAAAVAVLMPSTALADSGVTIVKGSSDITGAVLTCPTENVVFSGTYTYTEIGFVNQIGDAAWSSHGTFISSFNGVTAVGQTSGTEYRVVGVTASGYNFTFGTADTADTSRWVQTWMLVPVGGGMPLSFHEMFVVIFGPDDGSILFLHQGPRDCN